MKVPAAGTQSPVMGAGGGFIAQTSRANPSEIKMADSPRCDHCQGRGYLMTDAGAVICPYCVERQLWTAPLPPRSNTKKDSSE